MVSIGYMLLKKKTNLEFGVFLHQAAEYVFRELVFRRPLMYGNKGLKRAAIGIAVRA